jgi:CRISPR-associated protein (TIGR03984 family)
VTELWWTVRPEPALLADALTEAAGVLGTDAVGFLSTPTAHTPVKLDGAAPHVPAGTIPLDDVFATRVFSQHAELRWVQTGGGRGTAVIVAEAPAPVEGWERIQAEIVDVLAGTYALWGRSFADLGDGWCRTSEARIGTIDIPVSGPLPSAGDPTRPWPERYLALAHREYVGVDQDGNASVIEERLVEITSAEPTTGRAEN